MPTHRLIKRRKHAVIAVSVALASAASTFAGIGAAAADAALPANFQQIATAPITAVVHHHAFDRRRAASAA